MSYVTREMENDPANDPFARCEECREYADECICGDVATEGHVFYPGDEAALTGAIDNYVTRTPPHPLDGDE